MIDLTKLALILIIEIVLIAGLFHVSVKLHKKLEEEFERSCRDDEKFI